MTRNSTAKVRPEKSKPFQKPRPDFPLFPHATGRWAKKVRGKFEYFGRCDADPKGEAALQQWLDDKDDLLAGRRPRRERDGLTVGALCDQWLQAQEARYESGELSYRTFKDYRDVTDRLVRVFGNGRRVPDLQPDDFTSLRDDLAQTYSVSSMPKRITIIRSIFKYAVESRWIDVPVLYGPSFRPPSRKALRRHRALNGSKMFEAAELRTLIDAASVHMRAMILLGLNCGFGNADIGRLPIDAIDFKGRWIDHARGKTGEPRRCPIWKRTADAIQESLKQRPKAKDSANAGLVFITKGGHSWHKEESSATPLSAEFRKLLREQKLYQKGRGMYALRHVFATIAGDSRDQVAVNSLMGHVDDSMAGVYRERIEDARLRAVVQHVEKWLFPPKKRSKKSAK